MTPILSHSFSIKSVLIKLLIKLLIRYFEIAQHYILICVAGNKACVAAMMAPATAASSVCASYDIYFPWEPQSWPSINAGITVAFLSASMATSS